MNSLLDNPVYNALTSGDSHLGFGTDTVKFFDEKVSPFAGFEEGNEKGFDELHDLLPPGRTILFAIPRLIHQPKGWQMLHAIKGLQFVYDKVSDAIPDDAHVVALNDSNIDEMVQLAALTKPGPFGPGTIRFGHYYGIVDGGKLVAMTGQRLHVQGFTEISAVCTHPDYLGKGYAGLLIKHQLRLIRQQGKQPFLHVRDDNARAIELYKRLGFHIRGPMNFYVLKSM